MNFSLNEVKKSSVMRIIFLDKNSMYMRRDVFLNMDKDMNWLKIYHEKVMPECGEIYVICREVLYE